MADATERDAQTVINAIRHGYSVARMAGRPQHAIADTRRPGYRIVERVMPEDVVLARNIVAPRWNDVLERAKAQAYSEFTDAEPALERIADIARRAGLADATAEEFIDEILRYYVFCSNQRAQKENGGRVVDRKPTFFTRLFGTL